MQACQRDKVFLGGELVLDPRNVPNEKSFRAQALIESVNLSPAPRERSLRSMRGAGKDAQQRRLAAAIGAADHERGARRQRKADSGEQRCLATARSEIVRFQHRTAPG